MPQNALLTGAVTGDRLDIVACGSWTAAYAGEIERLMTELPGQENAMRSISVDAHGLKALDTFGAWLLERLIREGHARGCEVRILGLSDRYQSLATEMHGLGLKPAVRPTSQFSLWTVFETLGRSVIQGIQDLIPFAAMLGALTEASGRMAKHVRGFRFTSLVHQLDRVGWQAMPIILLITFLIGSIIAQQGFFHFRKFGADIYVVDMVGILVLREIGVLIVAIMVAGRSGSSYTAELGSMKMREEIDALRTMGLDPVEILVLPRVLALILALPILTFLGSMAALYGAGLVAWAYGDMAPAIFIERLKEAITVTHFKVGMIKAPFMALVIGIVACSEGLRVKGSAESLGLQTTISVVKSIFLVIVLDGVFAMFFASIGM